MPIPVWVLLGFAMWTLLTLFGSVGVYRWSRILTGRSELSEFRADVPHGSDWYRRAMRAHANCVENLVVYGAITVTIVVSGASGPTLDALAGLVLGARVVQTSIHIGMEPNNRAVALRFSFFFVQALCMLGMAAIVVATAA
jgi:uncharacterized MAPEG superfamily protein